VRILADQGLSDGKASKKEKENRMIEERGEMGRGREMGREGERGDY
jgi:hypothetical protein